MKGEKCGEKEREAVALGLGLSPPAYPAMGLGRWLLLRPRQHLSRLRDLLEESQP